MTPHRMTVSVWGRPKQGKTYLGFTFPAPILVIEIGETGSEVNLPRFPGKDIRVHSLQMSALTPGLGDYQKLLIEFEKLLREAVDPKNGIATLLVDSSSKLWKTVREVKVEEQRVRSLAATARKGTQARQTDYELANEYFEQVVLVARSNPQLNIVLVHRDRETWATDDEGRAHATGQYEPREFKDVSFLVNVVIKVGQGFKVDPRTKERRALPQHTIELCNYRPELEGRQEFLLDYDKIAQLIWGDRDAVN